MALAAALVCVASLWCAVGCRRDTVSQGAPAAPEQQREQSSPAQPQPPPAWRVESRQPVAPAAQVVVARPVSGWELASSPRPGIAYRYVRVASQEPYRPSVNVVVTGEAAESPAAYALQRRAELARSLEGFSVVAEQDLNTETPPLYKIIFTYADQGRELQAMQLYIVRSSGSVVVVTFNSTVDQWPYLQDEFRAILASLSIAP